ncbi:MAG: M56 family metallopeptidase, partial [bacterium]
MPIILKNLEPFFSWLLQTSWQASILAALILVLQRVFRKSLPPAWSFGLWLILIVKLLLPVSPSSQFSLFNFVSIEKLILNDQRAAEEDSRQGIGIGISGLGDEKQSASASSTTSGEAAPINLSLLLTTTWLAVAVMLLVRTAYVNIGVLSHARKLRPLIDGEVLNLLENCKSELRVHVPVSVVVT